MAIADALQSPNLQEIINKYSPFLMEVRKRLLFIASVFLIAMIVGFVFYEKIVMFLVNFLYLEGVNIVFTSPFQFINIAISTGVSCGLVAAFPLILAQFISFLKPALRKKEFKMIMGFLPFSIFLFLVGFISGFVMIKWQMEIFMTRSVSFGIGNVLDISKLLSVVILTSTLMGIGFQTPIVLLILMRIGILKHNKLAKARPWVYLGSFFFVLLLPPDSALFDILGTLPLVLLFEITLLLNKLFERKSAHKALLKGA